MKKILIAAFGLLTFASCHHTIKPDDEATANEDTTMIDATVISDTMAPIVTPDDNPTDTAAADMNEQSGSSVAGKNIVYTCKMHPEVQSGKPGKCPKCGKTLIIKK